MSASNGGKTRGRISLLAGSSLAAAGLTAFAGVALAPTAAMAQATCAAAAPTSGNGTNTVVYAAGTYNPGITCAYVGAGATVSTGGAVTVSSLTGGNGVNLSATGADAVNWVSTAGTLTGGAQTGGPVIDATSFSGAINIATAGITGSQIAVTHGIQAVSTGGGAITVSAPTGTININSNTAGAQQQSAIRAVTTGGNGAVSITTGGAVTGRLRGIEAQASGTGALTITTTNGVAVNTTVGVGVAAIDARTGTGLLTINVNTGTGSINGSSGSAIVANAGGNAAINIASGRTVSALATTAAGLNLTAVGSTTLTNAGSISTSAPGMAIKAAGGSFTLTNSGSLAGRVDLGSVTGASGIASSGTWSTSGASNFGAGASALGNTGTLTVSGDSTFSSLETFNNSGTIGLGANTLAAGAAAFTATGASRLLLTTNLDPAGSTACGLSGSGCLGLVGGTTTGVSAIVLTATAPLSTAYNPGVVLVDVAGGTSHAGDFVLDATSTGYAIDPILGPVLATDGLFAYTLGYRADAQQHVLASAPKRDAFEFAPIIQEALSTWHTTTDVVAGRQADLGAGASGGMWVRVGAEHSTRELSQSFTTGDDTFTADNGYSLETGTAIAGFDVVKGDAVTLGVHGGYVKSRLSFDRSGTRDEMTGPTVGVYGGWRAGPFSLDGAFNANLVELERTSPTFEDSATTIVSVGARAEAGWKLGSDAMYVQPLVTVAYVQSTIDDVLPTGYDITFEDAASARAAVGLRAGGEAGALRLWVVGRAWNEFFGDGAVAIANTGTATGVTFADDLSGAFQEIAAGLSVGNDADTLRGYISAGAKFADTIDNYSASVGLRLRW